MREGGRDGGGGEGEGEEGVIVCEAHHTGLLWETLPVVDVTWRSGGE